MSNPAERVLDEALKLTAPQRASVAAELLASLDGEADSDADAAWAAEIEKRIQRVRRGEATGRPWPVVRESLKRSE